MKNNIIGILLAAGQSSRYGSNKLLVPFFQVPLANIALKTAMESILNKTIVVTRPNDPLNWYQNTEEREGSWIKKECENASKGLSHSLRCGIEAAEVLGAKAVIIMLADQPLVSTAFINRLIKTFESNPSRQFVGSICNNVISPPILLSSDLFPEIYQLKGDTGAQSIIKREMKRGLLFKTEDPALFYDIDTKEDYIRLKQIKRNETSGDNRLPPRS